jgi:hypothetical protein
MSCNYLSELPFGERKKREGDKIFGSRMIAANSGYNQSNLKIAVIEVIRHIAY